MKILPEHHQHLWFRNPPAIDTTNWVISLGFILCRSWHRNRITIPWEVGSKWGDTNERLAPVIPMRWMNGLMTRANRYVLWHGYMSAPQMTHLRWSHSIRRRRSVAKWKTIDYRLDKWWCCLVPPNAICYLNMDLKMHKRTGWNDIHQSLTSISTELTFSISKLFQYIAEIEPKCIQLAAILL